MEKRSGKLYMVSLGIGDIDNMTIRAKHIIEQADVIFAMPFIQERYGALLEEKTLYDAGHAYFTDSPFNSAMGEDENIVRNRIHNAIDEGKTIAVLDYGDPTIYSPLSGYLSEFKALAPTVIPGISCFNAANAALAQEISGFYNHPILLTATINNADKITEYAQIGATMVFFTMKINLADIVGQLKRHVPDNTPAVIVYKAGDSASQQVYRSTVGNIVALSDELQLPWEYLLYVGEALR